MADLIREGRLFRVVAFSPSHRQLLLRSDALAVDQTTTQVEVYFGHVELMFLKPIYEKGLHVRRASAAEFAELSERHAIPAEDAPYTWMLERDGGSFVVSGTPGWREAEHELVVDRESLFDWSKPWPPDYPVDWGNLG
jgi:hypothetical protein